MGVSQEVSQISVIGHRGACGYELENSMRSFECAIACGAGMVECDVRRCASGELVIIHDAAIDRISNGSGYVCDLTLEQLRAFSFGGEYILTVQELLDSLVGQIKINFEIKESGLVLELAQMLIDNTKDNVWQREDFLITSFIHQEIIALKKNYSGIMCGPIMACSPIGYAACVKDLACELVVLSHETISKAFVDDIHKLSKQVFVYTVNDLRDIEHMIELCVDGIISDYPDRVKDMCVKKRS